MDPHRSDQPRIVYLRALNTVIPHQLPPAFINSRAVGGQFHHDFEFSDFLLGGFPVEAEAVSVRRACPDIPEFSNVLVRIVKRRTLAQNPLKRIMHDLVIGIGASVNPQQDVRIDQVRVRH